MNERFIHIIFITVSVSKVMNFSGTLYYGGMWRGVLGLETLT